MKTEDGLLTRYLVKHLQPLTEADPTLLANYVVALLKNNKPKKELQKLCVDQLLDFLGEGTKAFVVKLFHALEDGTLQATHEESDISKPTDGLTASVIGEVTEQRSSPPHSEKVPSSSIRTLSDHEEGTDDEDDDRNHKHRRRATRSRSFDRDGQEEDERGPYKKRNRPSENGQPFQENDRPLAELRRGSGLLHAEREGSTKFDRRISRDHGLNAAVRMNAEGGQRGSIRGGLQFRGDVVGPRFESQNGPARSAPGRGRGAVSGPWTSHDQRYHPFEGPEFNQSIFPPVPPPTNIYPGRALPSRGNPPHSPWGSYGHASGLANGSLDQALSLNVSMQSGRGVPMSSGVGMNIGLGISMARPRCPDFEERGYCLRGDLCPMEHGANRIVVEDVQSLSQFNLPVTLSNVRGMGVGTGPVSGPSSAPVSSSPVLLHRSVHDVNLQPLDDPGLLNGTLRSNLGSIEPDLYDPDQPLWNKDRPEVSDGMRRLPSFKKGQDEHDWESGGPDQGLSHSLDEGDSDRHGRTGTTTSGGSQTVQPVSSVWDRIGPVDRGDSSRGENGSRPFKTSGEGSNRVKILRKEISDDQQPYGRLGSRQSKGESEADVEDENISGAPNVSVLQGKGRGVSTFPRGESGSRAGENPCHSSRGSGPRGNNGSGERAQRTLYVSFIPSNTNRRELLLAHFQKFGDVLDIRIPSHSDRAFVQFSRREDAEAALISPDAVMGNRFIRLSWANRDSIPDSSVVGNTLLPSNGRTGLGSMVGIQALSAGGKEKAASGPHALEAAENAGKSIGGNGKQSSNPPAQKKQGELEHMKEEIRRKQEELALKRDDFRRKLDQISKQGVGLRGDSEAEQPIKKQPKLEEPEGENVGAGKSGSSADAPALLPAVEEGISSVEQSAAWHPKTSTVDNSKQVTGLALASTGSIPLPSPRGARAPFPRSSGANAGLAFNAFTWGPNRYKLDNRTTVFRILPPFPDGLSNIAAVNEHFATFGELSSVELEGAEGQKSEGCLTLTEKSVVRVTFGSRRAAEKAFVQGRWFQGVSLQLAWFTPSSNPLGVVTSAVGSRQGDISRESSLLSTPRSSISGTTIMEKDSQEEGKRADGDSKKSQVRLRGESPFEEGVQSTNEFGGGNSHSSQVQGLATQSQSDVNAKLDDADGGSSGIHTEPVSLETVH